MRSTSFAAFETKMSQCSSSWMSAKLSVKKWPDPVRTHAQRGVCSFAMDYPAFLAGVLGRVICVPGSFPEDKVARAVAASSRAGEMKIDLRRQHA